MTVIVEGTPTAAVADTTLPGGSLDICGTPYTLKANTPKYSLGERGGWEGAGVVFKDTSYHATELSGLTDGGSYTLTWSIYSKYGKCPKTSDQVAYLKLTDITKPVMDSLPDVCVGATVSPTNVTPAATANNETGTWTSVPPGVVTGNPNSPTQTIGNLKKGTYTVTWTITSTTCPGGNPVSRTFKVDSVPTVQGIQFQDPTCEGLNGVYTATSPSPTFSFPVHLKWTTASLSAGGPTRTFVTSDTVSPATITFASKASYKQSNDSATVVLTVFNTCGSSVVSHPVIWRLTPRTVDTINTGGICGSATGYYSFGTAAQANADTYTWSFGGNPLANIPYAGPPATDSVHIGPSDWAGVGSSPTLTVTLSNTCGTGVDTFTVVPVQTPAKLWVTLQSDKANNAFCGPQDAVLFTASEATNTGVPITGTYSFYLQSISTGNLQLPSTPPNTFTAPQGATLYNGEKVYVAFHADTLQCLVNTKVDTSLTVYRYEYPDSTILPEDTGLAVCQGAPIDLVMTQDTNGTGVAWYRSTDLTVPIHVGYDLPLQGVPSESGTYVAMVKGKVCSHTSVSRGDSVKVYDKPDPYFSGPDPLLIYYNKDSPGIVMPFGGTGTVDSVFGVQYDQNPDGWLSSQDTLYPTIKTTSDERPVTYTVTMHTGGKAGRAYCPGTAHITVINTLPLLIPNAFSPNGDGKNETWVIDGLGKYPNTQVKVYNRWGSAMFTDNYGYRVPWDGTDHGAELATGTYYYIVDLKGSPDGTDGQRSGSLTIVK